MQKTRREFLTGVAGVAGGIVLSQTGLLESVAGAAPMPEPDVSGIDHVVVVMMENRSFDHFLGWVPRSNGAQAGLTYYDASGAAHSTYRLEDFMGCAHPDPDHSYNGGREQYNNGACDGWLRSGDNDEYAIGYYTGDQLPFYGGVARDWTVCDNYFCSIMSSTYPNRFYQHAAATDRLKNDSFTSALPTIWDRLADAGLRGKYYFNDLPFLALWGTKYLPISAPYPAFLADCAAGTLPEVAYVDPRFLDEGSGTSGDDHPHADIRVGQHFLNQIYEAVTSSPAWPRTVLVINYDEWGGFYDHVAPTTAPDTDPAHALRGFRVPCVVISPFARRGHVAHKVYDHTSILKMIEWRWNVPALAPRDASARNLAEVLDLRRAPNLVAPRYAVPPAVAVPCAISENVDYEEWHTLAAVAQSAGWEIAA